MASTAHQARRHLPHRVAGEGAQGQAGLGRASSRPGIVVTDLLEDDYEGQPEAFEKVKKIFNILGDRVETVTPFLADGVLGKRKQRRAGRLAHRAEGRRPVRHGAASRKRDLWAERAQQAAEVLSADGRRPLHGATTSCSAVEDFVPVVLAGVGCVLLAEVAGRSLPADAGRGSARRRPDRPRRAEQGDLEAAGRRPAASTSPCSSRPFFPSLATGFMLLSWSLLSVLRGRPVPLVAVRRRARRSGSSPALAVERHRSPARRRRAGRDRRGDVRLPARASGRTTRAAAALFVVYAVGHARPATARPAKREQTLPPSGPSRSPTPSRRRLRLRLVAAPDPRPHVVPRQPVPHRGGPRRDRSARLAPQVRRARPQHQQRSSRPTSTG